MPDVLQALKKHFVQLSNRDQKALSLLSLFVLAVMVYLLLWQPLSQWSVTAKQDFQHQRTVNQWVAGHIHQATVQPEPVAKEHSDLPSLITQSAKSFELSLSRVQPGSNGLSVWLEQAPYPALLQWLEELEINQQLRFEQVRIDRLEAGGEVKAFIHISS
ncbi:hypothetical protein GZ78_10860 [Endozoicomonas numazuensis]|uniref:Type II secretion system protein M n=2 Tax=Endozoicomonas numazuensis TaxID=1137799 RepID=A0A081NHZ6_9GAMM|nr:hypothetical protein GZ78_10860 [Endozoicomonas numazuensis]